MPLEKRGRGVDVGAAEIRNDPAARRALDEPELEEVRLVDVLDRLLLLAEGDRERREPDRPAAELDRDRLQQVAVGALEPDRVHLVERERRQVERERARRRPLADDDVEPEVLERRVEDLLDRTVQAVDLVDEEDVAHLERGEDGGDVALPLELRAGDGADADAELLAD